MVWFSRFDGRLMIVMASKGHFLTQIPQPIQSSSDIVAILEKECRGVAAANYNANI